MDILKDMISYWDDPPTVNMINYLQPEKLSVRMSILDGLLPIDCYVSHPYAHAPIYGIESLCIHYPINFSGCTIEYMKKISDTVNIMPHDELSNIAKMICGNKHDYHVALLKMIITTFDRELRVVRNREKTKNESQD